jgi:phosphate transport system substrate-binding protein
MRNDIPARADVLGWKAVAAVAVAVGALAAAGMPAAHAATQLVGAGSTFDLPFFNAAFPAYQSKTGVSVTYSGIGSGGGIKQFTSNTVDFGATDVPMNASELQAAQATGSSVVQVPVALGGVAIAYNLPEVPRTKVLRLDAATLSNIFLDKITRWNDPAIAALNPGIHLPLTPILTVHRSDASGTTYIVTDYLSAVSKQWASAIGTGKSVSWPSNSLGGKGNPGVAAALSQHAGAIGYVELAYAITYKIPYAEIQNRAGSFQLPSQTTVRAAAAQFPHVSYKNFSIVNAPGSGSYPIAGYSWVLLRQHPKANASDLVKLFKWLTTSGQSYAAELNYVVLPANVQKLAAGELNRIK